ncbi:MAG: TonB-dependent receptor [Desulfobacterales bacterium]|nr:TonB-dependent receptor [Desulfobacterales bacterium]
MNAQNRRLRGARGAGRTFCLLLILFSGLCYAETPGKTEAPGDETVRYLKSLSLEELAGLEVTSVSRQSMKLSDAPAAVFVITNEDIRRSGVASIPDALRMAPGVEVARINANCWAITTRGFNRFLSNKMLVMIDGRSVYSPLHSEANWSAQDVLFEDVDRIEVIRGPGASLWGANAVNGIINIITKSAGETQGGLITAGAGTEERGFGGARYGTRVGENTHIRAFAKYFERDEAADWRGVEANDDWNKFLAGFRADWRPSADNSLTIQGDVYRADCGMASIAPMTTPPYAEVLRVRADMEGGNLLARWKHSFSKAGDLALQMYWDHSKMASPLIDEVRDTLDVDIQHGFTLGERHKIIWGLGYRWTSDHLRDVDVVQFRPDRRDMDLYNVFIQDRITLVENRLWLTIGSKFENGYYTDWETLPTGRLLWKPRDAHTFWAAVSRAARTPSRLEKDGHGDVNVIPPGAPANPTPLPIVIRMTGGPAYTSETLTAYEAGWRFQPSERLFFDLALFYNDYRDLFATEVSGPPAPEPGSPPVLVMPIEFTNTEDAQTRGLELAAHFEPLDWWSLRLAYTWFGAEQSENAIDVEGFSPEHQIGLRSSMDLPYNLELDLWPRYVDELTGLDIDSYITLDIRLGWRPTENLEFSLVGQNLLEKERPEFHDMRSTLISTAVERGVYGKVTWRF